jgi:hypothetical protein
MITVGNSFASLSTVVGETSSATLRNSAATPHSQPATRNRADLVQLQSSAGGPSELVS